MEHRHHHHHGGCSCEQSCCGRRGGFQRRFHTRAELIAELEGYRKDLQEELKAVEERIADLRSAG